MRKLTLFLLLSVLFRGYAFASVSDTSENKRSLDFSLEYGSNFTYRLHKEDKTIPYMYLSGAYSAPSGFWFSYGMYRTFNQESTTSAYPEKDFGLGWDFKFKPDTLLGGLSYSRSIYDRQNPLLEYALPNFLDAYLAWYYKDYKTMLQFDYAFGSIPVMPKKALRTTDIYLTWQNAYTFSWEDLLKADEIDLTPSFQILGGTDNFFSDALLQQTNPAKKKRLVRTFNISPEYAQKAAQFHLMEYVFQLSATYSIGNFSITPDWSYVVPHNISTDFELQPYPLYHLTLAYTADITGKKK